MDFTIDDLMRNSFVLARDEKEYGVFSSRLRRAGFDHLPRPYMGGYPKVLFKGVPVSLIHFVLVHMARMLDYDHITIFEADAYPMIDCRNRLEEFFADGGIPDDADEIVLGNLHFIRDWTNKGGDKCLVDVDEKQRFGRIRHDLWGSHAVVVFKRGYDTWINNYLKQENPINSDFFNWLTPNCYATARSFFIQAWDCLSYPDLLCDKEWLNDFPEIGKSDIPVAL